jgi:DNA-binding NarL/FixJ family response regulator
VIIVPRTSTPPARRRDHAPRVVLIDGQALFQQALAGLLAQPPLRARIRCAGRSDEGLEILTRTGADLVLCDLHAQPLPARAFLSALNELMAPPPVILLADAEEADALADEVGTAASGLFTKDTEPEPFLEGVRAVLAGHRAFGAIVIERLLARLEGSMGTAPQPGLDQLSPTELEILALVGGARTVEQIAVARGISQKTVRNHLGNIYRKLDLHSRTEAMLTAARLGLTPVELGPIWDK